MLIRAIARTLRTFAVGPILVLSGQVGWASSWSCAEPPDQDLDAAALAFLGKATKVETPKQGVFKTHFRVVKVWKGDAAGDVVVLENRGDDIQGDERRSSIDVDERGGAGLQLKSSPARSALGI